MVAVFLPNQTLFTITCLGAAKIGIPFTVGTYFLITFSYFIINYSLYNFIS